MTATCHTLAWVVKLNLQATRATATALLLAQTAQAAPLQPILSPAAHLHATLLAATTIAQEQISLSGVFGLKVAFPLINIC